LLLGSGDLLLAAVLVLEDCRFTVVVCLEYRKFLGFRFIQRGRLGGKAAEPLDQIVAYIGPECRTDVTP
jgi:hypothetical protein